MDWPLTIPEVLREAAENYGDAAAVVDVDANVVLSFSALAEEARRCARALIGCGIAPGDRVAIWAPNSWEWMVAALGAQSAGAILVPVNTRWKGSEAADVLRRSRARALVTVSDFLGVDYEAAIAGADLPLLETIIVARGAGSSRTLDWNAFLERGASVDAHLVDDRLLSVKPSDPSDLMYTSGTTGRPKGVLTTHGQTVRVIQTWSEIAQLQRGDQYLIVNPFFHTFGYKAGWLACLLRGATARPHAVFDASAVLDRIEREKITVLPGAPTLYQSLLGADRSQRDLSSLRLAVTGAANIPVDLVRRMHEELGFDTVLTAYGLTECTGVVTMCRAGDPSEIIAGTSGRAIPGVEVRIASSEGTPGEVCVRGYNVMKEYFDDPEATAQAIDGDGWLHTGDIGVLDAHGNLRITDRLKDMFIVGGFNVYPAEVEQALLLHPAVAQVAVVGVADERLGEVGAAFVVLRSAVTAAELIAWARERIANYKVPREVRFVDALPLTASGKVNKIELRGRYSPLV